MYKTKKKHYFNVEFPLLLAVMCCYTVFRIGIYFSHLEDARQFIEYY